MLWAVQQVECVAGPWLPIGPVWEVDWVSESRDRTLGPVAGPWLSIGPVWEIDWVSSPVAGLSRA